MKSKFLGVTLVCGLAILTCSCISTLDGRTRAVVPFTKDKIEGRYERPSAQVFAAAKVVLTRMGKLVSEDTINKILKAQVDTRTVWAKVDEVDTKITRVVVQVRTKGGRGDLELAAQVDKEIALNLATAP